MMGLFLVVFNDKTSSHGLTLKYRTFHFKPFIVWVNKHWNRLCWKAVEPPSSEEVKTRLDIFLEKVV